MLNQKAIYFLATALKNIINNSEKVLEKEQQGIIDGFFYTKKLLRDFFEGENKLKRIGLFGSMSTGKSSLINLLIGVDLLPVGDMQMSSVSIEILSQNSFKRNRYTIELTNNDGKVVQYKENISFNESKKLIKDCGSHDNDSLSENIYKIKIISNFSNSRILSNNGVLIDTPGVEKEVEESNEINNYENNKLSDKKTKLEIRNDLDWFKTSKILETTDFVLFLENAEYLGDSKSEKLYKYLKAKYDILSVLNKKDEREEDSEEELELEFVSKISKDNNHPICISCNEWEEGKKTNNLVLQKSSNIELLENKIIEKINQYTPERYFYNCLNNIKQFLDESNELGEINGKKYGEKIFEDSQLEFYEFIKANSCNYSDIFISFISSILKSIFIEMSFKSFLKTVVIHKNKLLSYRCSDNIIALAKSIYTKFHTNGIDC